MERKTKAQATRSDAIIGATLAVLCGWGLSIFPDTSNWWVQRSYDIPVKLAGEVAITNDVVIVQMDQASSTKLGIEWNSMTARASHAELVTNLNQGGCKWIVFDVWLANAFPPTTNGVTVTDVDQKLGEALCAYTNVILAATHDPKAPRSDWFTADIVDPPHAKFLNCVSNRWGTTRLDRYSDLVLRKHQGGKKGDAAMPLAWLVAKLAAVPVAQDDKTRQRLRWVRYYGSPRIIKSVSYSEALKPDSLSFSNKIVFVGSVQQTPFPNEGTDVYATPFSSSVSGVEVQVTIFLNLLRGDWLRTLHPMVEFLLITLFGLSAGLGFVWLRPRTASLTASGASLAIILLATVIVARYNYWFPWLVVVLGEIPVALTWSVLAYTRKLESTVDIIQSELSSLEDSTRKISRPLPVSAPSNTEDDTPIPTHLLLKRIGEGGFGEVWLGRNVVGIFHAVKIVKLSKFGNNPDPYDREFHGVKQFMPISKDHPNFVQILQVGRREDKGFFYYVMEAGDDERKGQEFDIQMYSPRNLSNEVKRRGALPVRECLEILLPLTSALEHLHQQRLIHRDIKPSNIIFVKGVPKLADIGLVTEMSAPGRDVSCRGTLHYMPPEGPGTSAGEVFSVGKVLYVLSSGKEVDRFPEFTDSLSARSDQEALISLNDVIIKATENEARHRYQTVSELRAELLRLHQRLTSTKS